MIMPPSLVGRDPSVIAPFLITLFNNFERENVRWAVMRGWEGLPYYTRHDVDILIAKADVKRALKIVAQAARQSEWVPYGNFKFSNLWSSWLLKSGTMETSYLQLDFFTEASLRGIPFCDSGRWLEKREMNTEGIWHTSIGYGAACTLLKELIANGKLDGELRRQQVRDAMLTDRQNFKNVLLEALVDVGLRDKIICLCQEEDWARLQGVSQLVKRRVVRYEMRYVKGIAVYLFDCIKMQLFPYLRLFIAFIGPDGCGKTTIANRIVDRFDHRPFAGLYRIKSDFNLLPRLRDIKAALWSLCGKKIVFPQDPVPGTRHMGMKDPLSIPRSMIYVAYYGMGLALGQVKLLFWRSFSGIIVADRYYYDYYYMRGHCRCPRWYLKLIETFIPTPNLIFVLERPAEDIYAQKPELSIDEIIRQQQSIRACVKNRGNARIIDASKGVEATVEAVSTEIEKWLVRKTV